MLSVTLSILTDTLATFYQSHTTCVLWHMLRVSYRCAETLNPSACSGMKEPQGPDASDLKQLTSYNYHFLHCIMTCSWYKQQQTQVLCLTEINLYFSGYIKGRFGGQNILAYATKSNINLTVRLLVSISLCTFLSSRQKVNTSL